MKATMHDVDIRGCEQKNGKNGPYLLVHFEEETGAPQTLVDKDMDRAAYYKRGTIGDFTIDITIGKYTNIRIIDFKISGKEGASA